MLPRPQFHIARRRLLTLRHGERPLPHLLQLKQGQTPVTQRSGLATTSTSSLANEADSDLVQKIPSSSPIQDSQPQFEPLKYHVHRTPSQQLPVYHLRKAGGTLLQTLLRKVEGDRNSLIGDLRATLGFQEKDVKVNATNGQIVIKGLHKQAVKDFLESKHF